MRRVHRYLWAFPASAIGLLVAGFAVWRGGVAVVDGVIEAHGPALAWVLTRLVPLRSGAAAMTFGHVVIGRDRASLARCRLHERVHVRQYERWGLFFFPAYFAGSAWALLRKRDPYFDNPFEVEAFQ